MERACEPYHEFAPESCRLCWKSLPENERPIFDSTTITAPIVLDFYIDGDIVIVERRDIPISRNLPLPKPAEWLGGLCIRGGLLRAGFVKVVPSAHGPGVEWREIQLDGAQTILALNAIPVVVDGVEIAQARSRAIV